MEASQGSRAINRNGTWELMKLPGGSLVWGRRYKLITIRVQFKGGIVRIRFDWVIWIRFDLVIF